MALYALYAIFFSAFTVQTLAGPIYYSNRNAVVDQNNFAPNTNGVDEHPAVSLTNKQMFDKGGFKNVRANVNKEKLKNLVGLTQDNQKMWKQLYDTSFLTPQMENAYPWTNNMVANENPLFKPAGSVFTTNFEYDPMNLHQVGTDPDGFLVKPMAYDTKMVRRNGELAPLASYLGFRGFDSALLKTNTYRAQLIG